MMAAKSTADVVVVGAGVAGLAAAYHLLVRHGARRVVVADPRPPLSGTSARSTECYRDLFDTAPLVALMRRSIDGMEAHAAASGNMFRMTRRGYAFVSAEGEAMAKTYRAAAEAAHAWGAGPVRVHHAGAAADDYAPPDKDPDPEAATAVPGCWARTSDVGFDVLWGRALVARHFPYLGPTINTVLHARRCGWVNAHLYGSYFADAVRRAGGTVVAAEAVGVELGSGDRVTGVRLRPSDRGGADWTVATAAVVNATGPFLQDTQRRLDPRDLTRQALHVRNELHAKISFRVPPTLHAPGPRTASLGTYLGRTAPMVILSDEVQLPWTDAERIGLQTAADAASHAGETYQAGLFRRLLGALPAGLHFRPYGHDALLALWEFVHTGVPVVDPPAADVDAGVWEPFYAEIVQRGLGLLVPALQGAVGAARVTVDGGYYCHAHDDHFLIGPHGPQGVFLCGGLRGVGIMAAEVWAWAPYKEMVR
jgi:sarcosine oxidase, subunit beta